MKKNWAFFFMKIFLVFILQNMSGNVPGHEYIFGFRKPVLKAPSDEDIDNLYYELNTAQAAMFNCTNDDLKLAQELRKAEAYVIELKDKSEFATKQRIKAKNYFDTVYAKIETVLSNLSNSNA